MYDEPIHITPARAIGMIQADLKDALTYVSQTQPMAIDAEAVKKHLAATVRLLDELHTMQLNIQALQGQQVAANQNAGGEANGAVN